MLKDNKQLIFDDQPRLSFQLYKKVENNFSRLKNSKRAEMMRINQLANLGKLSGALSHEIATPLTTIRLNLDLYKKKAGTCDEIKAALIGVEQIDKLLQNFLNQTKLDCNIRNFSIEEEIQKILLILDYRIRKTNTRILRNIKDINLTGNPVKFGQIILNLLNNSLDAFEENPKDNQIIKIISSFSDNNLIIKIQDNGKGINPSQKNIIFRYFYSTKKSSGTGLGLSIVQDIIRTDFGGDIKLINCQQPTEFEISLPIKNRRN